MRILSYLNRYLITYKWRFLLGILFVSVSNYFRILQPREIRKALNLVLSSLQEYKAAAPQIQAELYHNLSTRLTYFAAMVLLYALLMGAFMYFMRQTLIVMSRLIEYDLRKELFAHYLKLDHAFFVRNKIGDLMARISEDISKIRTYLGPGIMYMINLISLSVLIIYAMYSVSPRLTIFTLLPLPFLSVSIYIISSIIQRKSTAIQKQIGVLTSTAQESFSGIRVLKVFVKEPDFKRYFRKEAKALFSKNMEMTRVRAFFFPLIIMLIGLSNLLTIYIGGKLLQQGLISAGNLAEFVIYINMLTWPFTAIGWIASIVQEASASLKRILEILHTKPKIISTGNRGSVLDGHIRFEKVHLRYEDNDKDVLNGLSFEVLPHQTVAIVGKTGSGKSSIAELILRIIEPVAGRIYLSHHPIKDYDLHGLRKTIAYVPQDTFLFSETIADNIAFGVENPGKDQIVWAAKQAGIHDEIMRFSKAYDTMVGERGVSLSGGQKQRIAIARALIKQPSILILDDALSAVDTTTRATILNHLHQHPEQKNGKITLLTITHNFIHLDGFDNIFVLEDGKISQSGTARELLKDTNGYFYKVYHYQKRREEILEA